MSANLYSVVFRNSTVVEERLIRAKTIRKAAKKAEKQTRPGRDFPDWTVYAITLR